MLHEHCLFYRSCFPGFIISFTAAHCKRYKQETADDVLVSKMIKKKKQTLTDKYTQKTVIGEMLMCLKMTMLLSVIMNTKIK
jgi:hypothetical protein